MEKQIENFKVLTPIEFVEELKRTGKEKIFKASPPRECSRSFIKNEK